MSETFVTELPEIGKSVYLTWIAGLPCLTYEDGTLLEVDDLEANKYLLQQAFQAMWNK
jgi:hypothetical protein